jgi:hypothetical protein
MFIPLYRFGKAKQAILLNSVYKSEKVKKISKSNVHLIQELKIFLGNLLIKSGEKIKGNVTYNEFSRSRL